MPRMWKKILFNGGLNTAKDPRDLTNQVSDVSGMQFTQDGIIEPNGALVAPTGVTGTISGKAVKGYGLFVFGSDWDMDHEAHDSATTNNGGKAVFHDTAHDLADGDRLFHCWCTETTYNGHKTVVNKTANTYETGDNFVDASTGTYVKMFGRTNTANEKYIASADADSDAEIDIMPVSDNLFHPGMIDVGTTTGMKAVFYYVDGALRVCDANFGSGNSRKWFGYIKRNNFYTSFSGGVVTAAYQDPLDAWYSLDAAIVAPTRGVFGEYLDDQAANDAAATGTNLKANVATAFSYFESEFDDAVYIACSGTDLKARMITAWVDAQNITTVDLAGADTWQNDTYEIYPPVGCGFNVHVDITAADGTWTAQTIECASSFIYDGVQESELYVMDGRVEIVADDIVVIKVLTTKSYNERVSGGRIYYREYDTQDEWKLLADIDFVLGARKVLSNSYKGWAVNNYTGTGDAPSQSYLCVTAITHASEPAATYASLTGYGVDETSMAANYKSVTILNRRAWIANVQVDDVAGNSIIYGDRIMYSPVNLFDTFPSSYYLDVGINDGDEFTALQGYNDRILAFKSETLYIINVAQGSDTGWFLEDTRPHLGVEIPAATFKTDIGIVWVNKNGCYFYDGNKIHNLIEDSDGKKIINAATWNSTITADSIIGYDPIRKQILVLSDCDANIGTTYIFDFATKTWSHTVSDVDFVQYAGDLMTNFTILNNELIIGRYTD